VSKCCFWQDDVFTLQVVSLQVASDNHIIVSFVFVCAYTNSICSYVAVNVYLYIFTHYMDFFCILFVC